MSDEAFRDAEALLERADTWPGFQRQLRDIGLSSALSAADMEALRDLWLARRAAGFADARLAAELRHWAQGRGFNTHLEGFHAVPPAALAAEAQRRGWFVRSLPSGHLVSPPDGSPLHLPLSP